MAIEVKIWLSDIQQAITEIASFVADIPDFDSFKTDIKTKRAVERNVEIIGEAINRILQVEPDIKITNARKIIDTRNRIIHGYDSVSYAIIWAVVKYDLSILSSEVKELLKR